MDPACLLNLANLPDPANMMDYTRCVLGHAVIPVINWMPHKSALGVNNTKDCSNPFFE